MTDEELQSKSIDFLRFPLIVGVVLIHAHFSNVIMNGVNVNILHEYSCPIYDTTSYFFSELIGRIAVPLFFFISGFLFFYRSKEFSLSVYRHKLKNRGRSILLPYLFWNLMIISYSILIQTIPGLSSSTNQLMDMYSLTDWLDAFWSINGGCPICYQFWFLRDLIVMILFSPLIYILVKYFRWFSVFVLGVLWYFNWWFSLPGFSIAAFFFFSAGAYFSVQNCNFVALLKPCLFSSAMFYSLLALVCIYFREQPWINFIHSLSILTGIVLAISLSVHFIERRMWTANTFLVGGAFFIYAFHGIPLGVILKYTLKYLPVSNDMIFLSIYFLSAGFIILTSLGIYSLLKKWLPRFLSVVTGGR